MTLPTFAGVIDLLKKQETGLSSPKATPANMGATPDASSMDPSLRRDDDHTRGDDHTYIYCIARYFGSTSVNPHAFN